MKIGTAICYAKTIENEAIEQIQEIETSAVGGETAHIRVMPDAHAGAGCVIGTTMKVIDKVVPNYVGVDIGCGVSSIFFYENLGEAEFKYFDEICHNLVASGAGGINEEPFEYCGRDLVDELICGKEKSIYDMKNYYDRSFGTLGGGNHFIELGRSTGRKNRYTMTVHTGSRRLGYDVARYYQSFTGEKGYLEGQLFEDYIHDMELCQDWAYRSRLALLNKLFSASKFAGGSFPFTTIHNYIDTERMILRKGAISAEEDELCLIPLNMRDGMLLCRGKGNPEWNYSAPHGAGRIMSRGEARRNLKLEDYAAAMEGIYSTTICEKTIDEAPFAYKDYKEIVEAIGDTVVIMERFVPIYNFKATT